MSQPDRPVRSPDRIEALDVLRGVAVGGILFANVLIFFGLEFGFRNKPPTSIDRWLESAEHVLVLGKFYSIFSLLFGIGFGLQLARRGAAATDRFRRRLRVLMVIGLLHAVFVWAGDILLLYALLGLAMPWFAGRSDRSLLRWTAGLLATHTVLYALAAVVWGSVASGQPPAGDEIPAGILALMSAVGTGGFADAFVGNLVLLAGRWADLFATMRFPKILGMFVLGLWLVRRGMATNPAAHRPILERWRLIGLTGGLAANILATWANARWPYFPPTAGGLIGVAAQAIGFPLLAIGYATTVALATSSGSRVLSWFAPVGRMALSNYLMHSIVCVMLSYGFGFGLWGRVTASQAFAIAVVIVAIQIPLSRWWLAHYRYGPMEWVWRRLTYGEPLPMRATS